MESIVLLILGLLAMIVVILLAQIFVWAGDYLEKRQERMKGINYPYVDYRIVDSTGKEYMV